MPFEKEGKTIWLSRGLIEDLRKFLETTAGKNAEKRIKTRALWRKKRRIKKRKNFKTPSAGLILSPRSSHILIDDGE